MMGGIKKCWKYAFSLCLIGVLTYVGYISTARADICFLPGGNCESAARARPDNSGAALCVLVSCPEHSECTRCGNLRYIVTGCKPDYKLVNQECVCDGEDCGRVQGSKCSVELNSCGLCPTGKCMCKGTKCANNQKCSTRENQCGNCEGECVDQDKCPNGYSKEKPSGCSDITFAADGTTKCYKHRECVCEDFEHYQSSSNCGSCKKSTIASVGGLRCYKCETLKSCPERDLKGSCDATCETQLKEDRTCVSAGGPVCYQCAPKSCASRGLSESCNSNCYNATPNNQCTSKTGVTCYTCSLKTCSERGLRDTCNTTCENEITNTSCSGMPCATCSIKTCAQRGLQDDCDANCYDKTANTVCASLGKTCYQCKRKTCEGRGLRTSCNSCETITSTNSTGCTGQTCYTCRANVCSDYTYGPSGWKYQNLSDATCPAGYKVASESISCDLTCGKCVKKVCSDYGSQYSEEFKWTPCSDECHQKKQVEFPVQGSTSLKCYECDVATKYTCELAAQPEILDL
ncbi:MAG: hypothetical protein MJ212_05160, partial [Alphaproteobacteria bacterium]|nr:hypothetical protein [Alphaproteobacteria bacterium]